MAPGGLQLRLAVTFFDDFRAVVKREEAFTLSALAARIQAVSAPSKGQLPWLKLATFGDRRTEKNSLRHDANVTAITGLEADYDAGTMPVDAAVEIATKAGLLCIIYTSPSHTEAAPRWRVLCPLSRPHGPERREAFMGRLNGLFGGVFSTESWTLSQGYYFGAVNNNPAHRVAVVDGLPLDDLDELDRIWRGKPNTGSGPGPGPEARNGPVDEAALLREIASGASYHSAAVRLLGRWARLGVSYMEARGRLVDAMEAVPQEDRDERWTSRRADIDRCLDGIYGKEARKKDQAAGEAESGGDEPGMDGGAPAFTDENLALRFSTRHRQTLRYVAGWGYWLEWTGSVWKRDETIHVFDLSRALCRSASRVCNDDRISAKLASAQTVASIERLAKADRRHAATVGQWDTHPWKLNTPGGTVDLRTGIMHPHSPADHMTKTTAVAPKGECPLWHDFLRTVTNGDTELQAYLKRVAGYCLTGSIEEHALFFAYGTGANGKGVFINTLTGVMGDYAAVASMETFTASASDRHPTDLAMLRGARMVTAQETEEGRRWAESRIKSLTGGDPITARFMRQDFFTYQPAFKLFIAGNHRPALRGVDEAIRRRFHLVPFSVRIPPEQRDKGLPEKLKAEWPGILHWAIEGCLEWQRIGLAPPAAVVDATAEYMAAEDAAANWIEECCITGGPTHSASSELFGSWKAWAEAAGEPPGSQKAFSQRLIGKGFEARRLPGGRAGFVGLGLKATPQQPGRYRDDGS